MLLVAIAAPARAETLTGHAVATSGNVIEIDGKRIRLPGADAPDVADTCQRDGHMIPCGQQAALVLRDITAHKTVSCDVLTPDGDALIPATCRAGDIDLGRWMVGAGWALADRPASEAYLAEEAAARQARRGLWGMQFTPGRGA